MYETHPKVKVSGAIVKEASTTLHMYIYLFLAIYVNPCYHLYLFSSLTVLQLPRISMNWLGLSIEMFHNKFNQVYNNNNNGERFKI